MNVQSTNVNARVPVAFRCRAGLGWSSQRRVHGQWQLALPESGIMKPCNKHPNACSGANLTIPTQMPQTTGGLSLT